MMNPGMMMKMKEMMDRFWANHPRLPQFLEAVRVNGIPEGTIIEATVTYPDGRKMCTNIKVKAEDLELMEQLRQMR